MSRRSTVASVRFSPEEADRLRERAQQRGLTLSELVRCSALEGERVELPWAVTVVPCWHPNPGTTAAAPTHIEWPPPLTRGGTV